MFKQQSARIIEALIENPNLSSKEVAAELMMNLNILLLELGGKRF